MNCTHKAIRSWSQLDGSPVQMWSCVDCGWRFEPRSDTKEASNSTEPVAWMVYTLDGKSAFVTDNPADFTQDHQALPLYTTPPQRQPLTKEEIANITASVPLKLSSEFVLSIARAIERAHGIGEKE